MRSDQVLVKQVLRGDAEAFAVLVERYERAAFAAALQVVGDRESARDVAQEAFLAAFEKLGSLREPSGFAAWLLRIVRNKAVSHLRKHCRIAVPYEEESHGMLEAVQRADRHDELLDEVAALPERERIAVMMRFFEGMSVKEIAAATGRPVGSTTKLLSRAYERLRAAFADRTENE